MSTNVNSKNIPMLKNIIILISIIGGIVLIGVIISILKKYIFTSTSQNSNQFGLPPLGYMDTTTLNCPDFWSLSDISNNIANCINRGPGLNNTISTNDDTGAYIYNKNEYKYPYDSITDVSFSNIPIKILSNTVCDDDNAVDSSENYMCPYSHPYSVIFNSSESRGFICTNDGNTRTVTDVSYNYFKNNYLEGSKKFINCQEKKSFGNNKYNFLKGAYSEISNISDISNCDLPGFRCINFSKKYPENLQNLCPPDYPIVNTEDNTKCCKFGDGTDCGNFYKVNGSPFETNNFTCPTNYPIALDDTNGRKGVFCSKNIEGRNINNGQMSFENAQNNSDIVGCNKTNLNILKSEKDTYFSCSSDLTCPNDYPYVLPQTDDLSNNCCNINPKTDLDNNCPSMGFNKAFDGDKKENNYPSTLCTNERSFPVITEENWSKQYKKALDKNDMTLMRELPGMDERCNWVKECGRVWQGIAPFC